MTDETRADIEDAALGGESALLDAQDDFVAAAVDMAVETEQLDLQPARGGAEARREGERRIAGLPEEERIRIQRMQQELRMMGAEVWPVSRWWGYEIHLNESAALLSAEIPQLVGEMAGVVLGAAVAPAVERRVRDRAEWIASIARPYGVKLVSPWTAPGMLVPARQDGRTAGDMRLYWAVHEPEEGWSPGQRFVEHFSVSGPALAVCRDRLHLVHRGDDSALRWAVYDAEQGWSEEDTFPSHLTGADPALAAYDGQLYCVHRGAGGDMSLWWTRWDGSSWSADERLPSHLTDTGPALAAYDGQLYCVHRGAGGDTSLWWTRWDGSAWSPDQKLPGHQTSKAPALAAYKDRLVCVHRGATDHVLWWTAFDGSAWSAAERLPGHRTAERPALVSYRDRNATCDQLLCFHRG